MIERIHLVKTDTGYVFETEEGKIEVTPLPKERDTIVVLYSGSTYRKITLKNITNVAEAVRDSLETMSTFVKSSNFLKESRNTLQKNLWPTLDGETIVPTFDNVEIEKLNLSPRNVSVLEKNGISVLGQVPTTLDSILSLKGIGPNAAKEILKAKQDFLNQFNILEKVEKKRSTKASKKQESKIAKKQLIVGSVLPKNLQKLLTDNALVFLEEVPRDIKGLMNLKKMGPSKARQILNLLEQ